MANGRHSTKLGGCIFILIALSLILNNGFVDGRRNATEKQKESVKHKGTIKTIEAKDGDVIDCVDIYKQPAFDHPLLKDHVIQMKPSSYPSGLKAGNVQADLFQCWLNDEQCPEGTIPIIRTPKFSHHSFEFEAPNVVEYSHASLPGSTFFGATAFINVWNPVTYDGEYCSAQIRFSFNLTEPKFIEAGWMVKSGEKLTRFYISNRNSSQSTGCNNLDCPGFVQVYPGFSLGATRQPVSTYGGQQHEMAITIHKDNTGNWWVYVGEWAFGYWPPPIFTVFPNSSNAITWCGEVIKPQDHHISTQMGSGHFSNQLLRKASYFRNLKYIDDSGTLHDPYILFNPASNFSCYDLKFGYVIKNYGWYFYYGGPGCQ